MTTLITGVSAGSGSGVAFALDGSGNSPGLAAPDGSVIVHNLPIYKFSKLPDAASVKKWSRAGIDPDCLTGGGVTTLPIEIITDGNKWMFYNKPVLFQMIGSAATPAVSMGAQNPAVETVFAIPGGNPCIPAFFSYLGCGYEVEAIFAKTGADTASSQFNVRFGSNNTLSDNLFWFFASGAAALREELCLMIGRVTSLGLTNQVTVHEIPPNNIATSTIRDRSSSFSHILPNYFNFTCTPPNITSTHILLSFTIRAVA